MSDCSDCKRVIESGKDYFCHIDNNVFLLYNYPAQGESCKKYVQKHASMIQKSKDPLLAFFNKRKIVEKPKLQQELESKTEISFRAGLGWIVAAILGGALIGIMLLGFL